MIVNLFTSRPEGQAYEKPKKNFQEKLLCVGTQSSQLSSSTSGAAEGKTYVSRNEK